MKAVIQRVTSATVTVDKNLIASIGKGILVFAAVGPDDTRTDAESMAAKVLKLRIWPDDNGGTWKKSVQDIEGEVLCVSQFTLMGQVKKGNKPDFHGAADVEKARELYDHFHQKVRELYVPDRVKNGVFQAMMEVGLVNDGPVGVDYSSADAAVTLEIQTNPPKSEKKSPESSGSGNNSKKEKNKDTKAPTEERKQYEFQLPASLLE